jgi:hypothetical protein
MHAVSDRDFLHNNHLFRIVDWDAVVGEQALRFVDGDPFVKKEVVISVEIDLLTEAEFTDYLLTGGKADRVIRISSTTYAKPKGSDFWYYMNNWCNDTVRQGNDSGPNLKLVRYPRGSDSPTALQWIATRDITLTTLLGYWYGFDDGNSGIRCRCLTCINKNSQYDNVAYIPFSQSQFDP